MDPHATQRIYKTVPPKFGREMRKLFAMDPEYVNLNNGSYGAPPLPVKFACDAISEEIERNADRFLRITYQPLLINVRARLAKLIGAKTDECVMVPNASHGINTVLRNFDWKAEDLIITFSTTYGSILRTAQYLSDVSPHPKVHPFVLEFPTTKEEIVRRFKEHLNSLPSSQGKKLAIIDSIVSNPGVLLPWQDLVKICKDHDVYSLIDAAHSIGQELDINLTSAGPDFWVSNCHKWLHAKRAVAVLYVPERNQHLVKSSIPTSHTYISPNRRVGPNFVEQYEWNGTIDFAPIISVGAALDFRQWLGGEHAINNYCHDLAVQGGQRLAAILGTRVLDPNGEFTLNMVNVELPLPGTLQWTVQVDAALTKKLLVDHNVYAAHFYHAGRWWTRCSVQVWNEIEDFDKIGKAFMEVCADVVKEFELGKGEVAKL